MSEAQIVGKCPHCNKRSKFREFTLSECLVSAGGFFGEILLGGISKKVKNISALTTSYSDNREFPNYKCGNCSGEVMQCSACNEIIAYEHDGSNHICGNQEITSREGEDKISKLERLAALKEKGFITNEEFSKEKKKILG